MLFFRRSLNTNNKNQLVISIFNNFVFHQWLNLKLDLNQYSNIFYFSLLKNFLYTSATFSTFIIKQFITKNFLIWFNISTSFIFNNLKKLYYPYHWVSSFNDLAKYNHGLIISKNYYTMITKYEHVHDISLLLKNSQVYGLDQLLDICVTDYPQRKNRFELLYCFLSVSNNLRFFVKTFSSELDSVKSLSDIFQSANWLEREAWDLYGVFFENHPNLRRILTDYGFKGFPFRKDFPLTGYVEVRYDDESSSVVYEPLEISQEFRSFNFRSPWEEFVV